MLEHTARAAMAAAYLEAHGQEVTGLAGDGVCVRAIFTIPHGNGHLVGSVATWVPAKREALRNFMGY